MTSKIDLGQTHVTMNDGIIQSAMLPGRSKVQSASNKSTTHGEKTAKDGYRIDRTNKRMHEVMSSGEDRKALKKRLVEGDNGDEVCSCPVRGGNEARPAPVREAVHIIVTHAKTNRPLEMVKLRTKSTKGMMRLIKVWRKTLDRVANAREQSTAEDRCSACDEVLDVDLFVITFYNMDVRFLARQSSITPSLFSCVLRSFGVSSVFTRFHHKWPCQYLNLRRRTTLS